MFDVTCGRHFGFSRKTWPHVSARFQFCTICICPLVDISYRYRDMADLSLAYTGRKWIFFANIQVTAEYANDVISGQDRKYFVALPSRMCMLTRYVQYLSFLYPLVTDYLDPCKFDRFRQDSNPRISVRFWATITGSHLFDAEFRGLQKMLERPEAIGGLLADEMRKKCKNRHFLTGGQGGSPPRTSFCPHIFSDGAVGQKDDVQTIWIDFRKKLSKKKFFFAPQLWGYPPAPPYPPDFCFLFRCVRPPKLCLLPTFGINATILEYFTEFWWFFTFYLIK